MHREAEAPHRSERRGRSRGTRGHPRPRAAVRGHTSQPGSSRPGPARAPGRGSAPPSKAARSQPAPARPSPPAAATAACDDPHRSVQTRQMPTAAGCFLPCCWNWPACFRPATLVRGRLSLGGLSVTERSSVRPAWSACGYVRRPSARFPIAPEPGPLTRHHLGTAAEPPSGVGVALLRESRAGAALPGSETA